MKQRLFLRSVAALTVAFALSMFANNGYVIGQEEAKPAAEKKVAKKPRGRLPAYFSAVVDAKQREAIYAVQAKYKTQLEELQKQIAALEEQRDKEVDAVLSAEQLAEVNKKREEAAKKREERKKKPTKPAAE